MVKNRPAELLVFAYHPAVHSGGVSRGWDHGCGCWCQWHGTCDMWNTTHDIWHNPCGMWHIQPDTNTWSVAQGTYTWYCLFGLKKNMFSYRWFSVSCMQDFSSFPSLFNVFKVVFKRNKNLTKVLCEGFDKKWKYIPI